MRVDIPGDGDLRHISPQLLIVDDPDHGTVAVRFQHVVDRPAWRWKCARCGHQMDPRCAHTFAAALFLAGHLLGLQPMNTTP